MMVSRQESVQEEIPALPLKMHVDRDMAKIKSKTVNYSEQKRKAFSILPILGGNCSGLVACCCEVQVIENIDQQHSSQPVIGVVVRLHAFDDMDMVVLVDFSVVMI